MIKKKKKKRFNYQAGINITPLLDVLTVLLFFLIKSMSVTSVTLSTPADIKLPIAQIKGDAEEAIVLSLSENELRLDQETLLKITNGKFNGRDIASDKRTLSPLKKILDERYKKRKDFYKDIENVEQDNIPAPKLLVQSDKELPFGLMKFMLHTVAQAGYTDYQFVVLEE